MPQTVRLLCDALHLGAEAATRLAAAAHPDPGGAGDGPARAAPVTPAQLPADVAGFAGRRRQLEALDALLAGEEGGGAGALVISALDGTAGVGKTALAVHWAHRVGACFPDGQLYVNLQGWGADAPLSPLRALAHLLAGLGLAPEKVPVELEPAAATYRSLLSGRRVLVVLDNARDAGQVRPLLPGGAGCLVVVTSRDRLAGLVASHGAKRLTLDVLDPGEAVVLLESILGRDRVAAEPEAAADLAEACAFLPLALRIAGANLAGDPDQPLAAYAARLREGNRDRSPGCSPTPSVATSGTTATWWTG